MINGIVVPAGYSYEEWDETRHADRIFALQEYSKMSNSHNMLYQIKDDIEYYQNVLKQIEKMTG